MTDSTQPGGSGKPDAQELGEGQDEFVKMVLADLARFESHHEQVLTPEERMSFIAGHAAGYSLGQKVEAVRHDLT